MFVKTVAGLALAGLALSGCGHTARTGAQESHAGAPDLKAQCFSLVAWTDAQQNTESAASVPSDADVKRGDPWAQLRGTANVTAIKTLQTKLNQVTAPTLRQHVKDMRGDLGLMLFAISHRYYPDYQLSSQSLNATVTDVINGPCKASLD